MRPHLTAITDAIGRHLLCRFGRHTKPTGYGVDACARDCGFSHNPGAWRRWKVVLRTGEEFEVKAVNEYHAGTMVVYGGVTTIRVEDGQVNDPAVRVHRDNIVRVDLLGAVAD